MKIFVGLGNPGKEYENTRHNTGFMVIEKLASALNSSGWKFSKKFNAELTERLPVGILVKPHSFMNDSGFAVKKISNFYKLNIGDIWVIHDDLDIPLGKYKIEAGHGPKDHNGINSIEKALRSEFFIRVRVGIDNRPQDNRPMGEEYVLQVFPDNEREIINRVIKEVVKKITAQIHQKKPDMPDRSEEFR